MEPGRKEAWSKMKIVADIAAEAAESLYDDPAGVDYFDLELALKDIQRFVAEAIQFVQDPPFDRSVVSARSTGLADPATCKHPVEEWVHEYDDDSRLGDWYWCGLCGELTQVG